MAESPEPAFVRNPEVISSATPEAVVALYVQSGDCYSFTGPSARIWELLEAPMRAAQVVETLMREFAVEESTCRAEVDAYLAKLEREGLVKAADARA